MPNTSAKTTFKRHIFKNYFPFTKLIIDQGRVFSLPDLRDTIHQDDDVDLKNNEIKSFPIKEFGDSISFWDPERKDQSFAFSSSTEVQDVINFLQNIDAVKCAAIDIRKSLLDVNFELENSFCDAHQLKQSWKETKILHVPFQLFAALFNVSITTLMRSKLRSGIDDCSFNGREGECKENTAFSFDDQNKVPISKYVLSCQ